MDGIINGPAGIIQKMKSVWLLLLAVTGLAAQDKTGPEIGAAIPDFTLPDQHGAQRTFADLRGPNGLVLVFSRSADW